MEHSGDAECLKKGKGESQRHQLFSLMWQTAWQKQPKCEGAILCGGDGVVDSVASTVTQVFEVPTTQCAHSQETEESIGALYLFPLIIFIQPSPWGHAPQIPSKSFYLRQTFLEMPSMEVPEA